MNPITYGQIADQVLRLIDEYSRKGVANAVSKTADYRLKIPDAVNEIQMDLANSFGRLYKEWEIANAAATYPTETSATLPVDWLKMAAVNQVIDSKYWVPFTEYRLSPTAFLYNSTQAGKIVITYFRKPTAVAVADTAAPTVGELAQIIDVIPAAEYIVPIGVAGKILMVDDPTSSVELLNYYEARKFALEPGRPSASVEVITDMYGGL